jgi:hypothetical protein
LRDLAQRFGNLGLAAAAYNAGPGRIRAWLAKKSNLPQETKDYVKTITGRPAENWTAAEHGSPALKLPRHAPCQQAAGLLAWDGPDRIPLPPTREVARKDVPPAKHDEKTKQVAAKDVAKVAAKSEAKLQPKSEPKSAARREEHDAKAAPARHKHRHIQVSER